VQSRDGLFQRAEGGTLFLDEIGDLPLPLQPKLLRVLEERRVRPLGSSQEVALDVRIVAATNRDLEHAVRLGQFREDLLFRLNVHHIHLPPLRDRGGDVMELTQYFLARGVKAESLEPDSIDAELVSDSFDNPESSDALPAEGGVESSVEGGGVESGVAASEPANPSASSAADEPPNSGQTLSAAPYSAAAYAGAPFFPRQGLAPSPLPIDEANPSSGVAPFPGINYRLSPEAETLIRNYRWPGNVRELENALCGAMALAKDGVIGVRELPSRLESSSRSTPPPVEPVSLEEMERRHIEIVLRATGRNKALAARKLGIDRATLYRKLLRLGLSDPQR
jgi:transcriptional regulator with PAS, ATPase and Fis domain